IGASTILAQMQITIELPTQGSHRHRNLAARSFAYHFPSGDGYRSASAPRPFRAELYDILADEYKGERT
ncbi:hypothetical protein BS47DRAFT_1335407, partial [Hydnum rufescens UP504]